MDCQEIDLLNNGKLEKSTTKKQQKEESQSQQNEQEENIFLKMQEEINKLKETVTKLSEPKQKRERTDGQKRAFEKARAIAHNNAQLRLQEKVKLAEQMTKEYEEKILKKAISIKKKEIREKAKLEQISDDETPMEKIKQISSKLENNSTCTPHNFSTGLIGITHSAQCCHFIPL